MSVKERNWNVSESVLANMLPVSFAMFIDGTNEKFLMCLLGERVNRKGIIATLM